MKNKVLVLFLALCLVLAMLPMTVHAARPGQALSPSGVPELQVMPETPVVTGGDYHIIKSSTGPGSIASSPADSANAGDEVMLSINPDPGYQALVNDHGAGLEFFYLGLDIYVFTMPAADVILDFYFEPIDGPSYDVTVEAPEDCSWYVMDEVTTAKAGESVYLFVWEEDSYTFNPETDVTANCEEFFYLGTLDEESGQHIYELFMPDHDVTLSISTTPAAVSHYIDVRVNDSSWGGVTLESGDYAKAGETVTVFAEPHYGYKLSAISTESGAAVKSIGNHRYTFTMPNAPETVYVDFAENPHPITVTVEYGLGGTARADVTEAKHTDAVFLTCTPEEGYRVARITGVEGLVEHSENRYLFIMPDEPVELKVLFLREENPFLDVNETHFFYDSVLWAAEEGITSGISDTAFAPFAVCNRAQVVTFLWRYAGYPEPAAVENPFTDVSADDFYYKPVLWALENGITNGISSTEFGSELACNRAQVVTFLWRLMGQPTPGTGEHPFTDVEEGSFYELPVMWALENGITTGADVTRFDSTGQCLRAQVVTFLYRTAQLEQS